jgi:glycosyltransferase involved in cell wall biosynthesis
MVPPKSNKYRAILHSGSVGVESGPDRLPGVVRIVRKIEKPVVSILMPVRDSSSTLASCLRSVRRQSYNCWECVVVDDHSSDGTFDIAMAAAGSDPRFRVVRQDGEGLVPALNHGLSLCEGRYVSRMDGDDLMRRDRLLRQVDQLESDPGLAGVGCRVRMFPRKRLGPGMREYETWLNRIGSPEQVAACAWIECPVAHPALTVRTEILKAAGYRDTDWPEDYDLVLRLLGSGCRIGIAPERLLMWRRRRESLAMTDPRYRPDRFTACKAEHLCRESEIGFLSGATEYILWGYGSTGRALARELRKRGRHPSLIVDLHPGRIGNRILGAAVVRPQDLPGPATLPLVVSVSGSGPRNRIREELARRGWRETRDFICAA